MQLWLLRHARARAASAGENDQTRPLTDSGGEAALRLGEWIRGSGLELPTTILVSPAVRTRQTLERLLKVLNGSKPRLEPRLWDALEEDLIRIVADNANASDGLMLVGHNPGMEWLMQWLTNQRLRLGMQPGTLVIIETQLPLTAGSGRIDQVVQPNELT